MLTIFHGNRRGFLQVGTAALGGMTLVDLLRARAAERRAVIRSRNFRLPPRVARSCRTGPLWS